jgi:hypothetical protein
MRERMFLRGKAQRFTPSDMFFNASDALMQAGYAFEVSKRVSSHQNFINPISSATFIAINTGRRIKLLAPAFAERGTDANVTAGAWSLKELFENEKIDPAVTTILPLLTYQGAQPQWVLLTIGAGKYTVQDPRSRPLIDSDKYNTSNLETQLSEFNLKLNFYYYMKIQPLLNPAVSGHLVAYIINKSYDGSYPYGLEVGNPDVNSLKNNTANIEEKGSEIFDSLRPQNFQYQEPKLTKPFSDFLSMYTRSSVGSKICERYFDKAKHEDRHSGMWSRVFNDFPMEWPGYELVSTDLIEKNANRVMQIFKDYPNECPAELAQQVTAELRHSLVEYSCKQLLQANGVLKDEYATLIGLNSEQLKYEEIAQQILGSYLCQIVILAVYTRVASLKSYRPEMYDAASKHMMSVVAGLTDVISAEIARIKKAYLEQQEHLEKKDQAQENSEDEQSSVGSVLDDEEVTGEKSHQTKNIPQAVRSDGGDPSQFSESSSGSIVLPDPYASDLQGLVITINSFKSSRLGDETHQSVLKRKLTELANKLNEHLHTPGKYTTQARVIAAATTAMLQALQDENGKDIVSITKEYEQACKDNDGRWMMFGKAILAVIAGVLGCALGVTIGVGVGALIGSWSGPFAIGVSVAGALTGSTFFSSSSYLLFKRKPSVFDGPVMQVIDSVNNYKKTIIN